MTREEYWAYLRSPAWQQRRQAALGRADGRCEHTPPVGSRDGSPVHGPRCDATQGLQVHHRTYARVGNEEPEDLAVLCETHHAAATLCRLKCAACGKRFYQEADAQRVVEGLRRGGYGGSVLDWAQEQLRLSRLGEFRFRCWPCTSLRVFP
jgi:hypothetical protein